MRLRRHSNIEQGTARSTFIAFARASIQPIHCCKKTAELAVVARKSGQPFAEQFAFPPCSISDRREFVAIKSCADVMRRCIREWIVGQQGERTLIVAQKFPNKMQCPRIFGG